MATISLRRLTLILLVLSLLVGAGVFGLTRGGPSAVRAETPSTNDTVSVTGVGHADGRPDTLSADFRVHVTRTTVAEAVDAESAAAHNLLDALEEAGVDRHDMRTTDLNINEHYDNHGTVVGYDVSETVRASIKPLSDAGHMISDAATSAGDNVDVGSISLDIEDDDPLVTQARSAAFDDAKARAEQYAELAGRSLGRVERITEHINRPAPNVYYGRAALMAADKAASPIPVRGGTQTLTVRVSVVWSLA
jgi:uncharacterized protein YggE